MTLYQVKLRRKGFPPVKENAEQLDGNIYNFEQGWVIEKSDSSIYVNEYAMIAEDNNYPSDAPIWIASGDLRRLK